MKIDDRNYKTFSEDDLGEEFFFIYDTENNPHIKTGKLDSIITVVQKPLKTDIIEKMGIKSITKVFLKLYNEKDEKYYQIYSQDVHQTYGGVCDVYRKYIK